MNVIYIQGAHLNFAPLATLRYFCQKILFQLETFSVCRGDNLTQAYQVLFQNIQ